MRKQELVQLHALCVVVRAHLQDRHDVPADSFRSYDDHDVTPTAIHRRKDAHREALLCILDDLATVVEDRSAPSEPARRSPTADPEPTG